MVLPASMRLRGQRCFNRLHRSARRHHGELMLLREMKGDQGLLRPTLRTMRHERCRCAVIISGKVSKRAVRRNRLRRLLHDHLRYRLEHRSDLAGRWLLISLRPEAGTHAFSRLIEECDSLLKSAGLVT